MLTGNDKDEITDIVVKAIKEVVLPAFDNVASKDDIKKVEERLESVEERLESVEGRLGVVESRLETVDRKVDKIAEKQFDYGQRLGAIESVPSIAHQLKKKK